MTSDDAAGWPGWAGDSSPGTPAVHPRAVVAVKAVHTAVFLAELASIAWLVVSGWMGRRDRSVAFAATAVMLETAVFVGNGLTCPLTPLAERLGATRGAVTDIFLPAPVARTIPIWSGGLVALAAVLHLRSISRSASPGAIAATPR